MLFQQFLDDDLGCASYLVGDEDAGIAAIVDPPYAIEPVLEAAARRGVRIVRTVETHTHADHLSGHGRLALDHGVPVSIHPAAEAEYAHEPLEDGAEIELGEVTLRAIHTPGHRPEHTCLAVIDRSRADEPWLVLTGDSLFVGDVARPDLAVGAKEGAEGLFHSLRRLLELPDGVEVFPGHVAGSLCGKSMSSKASSTIGFERRFNHALQLQSELEFVADSASSSAAPKPPNMVRLVELNRGPFVGAPDPVAELPAAPPEATVLDVRPAADFLSGHVHGALNVPVSGSSFATKAGFLLDSDEMVAVQATDEAEAERAIRGLRAIGFLEPAGFVLGAGPELIEPVRLDELDELLAAGAEVIDVRERDERDGGYIAGTRNIPYRLLHVCGADFPGDRPVVTICESGARAGIAASILAAKGVAARPVLDGGITEWAKRGGTTVEFRRCGS
ncbi:MAG TPA: rhodanese-like domain-containing protein [Gaiellaceae bacterium]|nr:rhodanese-like domain-containing protein [Gaiellaceae bacterium]